MADKARDQLLLISVECYAHNIKRALRYRILECESMLASNQTPPVGVIGGFLTDTMASDQEALAALIKAGL
jgi:hypothetical protein